MIGTSVWAANYGDGTVSRIDAATSKVTATIVVGKSPDSFAMIGGRLWVFDQASSAASVIDLASDKVIRTVSLPVQAGWAAAGAGEVWVPDLQGSTQTMIGLDRVTGKIKTTVHLSASPSEVAFGFGSGWVTSQDAVYRFNTSTGAITAKISSPGAGFDGIAISGGAVWAGEITGRVDRISLRPTRSQAPSPCAAARVTSWRPTATCGSHCSTKPTWFACTQPASRRSSFRASTSVAAISGLDPPGAKMREDISGRC